MTHVKSSLSRIVIVGWQPLLPRTMQCHFLAETSQANNRYCNNLYFVLNILHIPNTHICVSSGLQTSASSFLEQSSSCFLFRRGWETFPVNLL